jgi:hypothetical protein
MTNRELYFRDPTTIELLNNGVSKVSEIGHDERQIKTLRFELETFVCDGEYARGLERIIKAYLDGLGREEQKAVWVSGFFGSGKSQSRQSAPLSLGGLPFCRRCHRPLAREIAGRDCRPAEGTD